MRRTRSGIRNETVWALTPWMDSLWLARRIARAALGTDRDVRVQRLSADRIRRLNRVEVDGRACIAELSLRRNHIRAVTTATATATEHGLSVASLLASDARASALLRFGTAWAAFEYVEGRHPAYDGPIEELDAIATVYAQVHAVTRSHPGLGQRAGSTLDAQLTLWNEIIARCGAAPWLPQWLARNRPEVPPPYQLVHGDANRGNTLLRFDGRAVLVDLGRMHFGLAPVELVYLLLNYCNRDAARRSRFVEVYRKQLGDLFDTTWVRHGAFWLAAGFLGRAQWRLRVANDRHHAPLAGARTHGALGAVERAGHIARLCPDGGGDLDQILDRCWETQDGVTPNDLEIGRAPAGPKTGQEG